MATTKASVRAVEIARVILNYENRIGLDGQPQALRLFRYRFRDKMLLSKRLKSIVSLVGGTDDTSLRIDRQNFHSNESTPGRVWAINVSTVRQSSLGTVLRKYVLDYETSPSSIRSRLLKVTECDGDNKIFSPRNLVGRQSRIPRRTRNSWAVQAVRHAEYADQLGWARRTDALVMWSVMAKPSRKAHRGQPGVSVLDQPGQLSPGVMFYVGRAGARWQVHSSGWFEKNVAPRRLAGRRRRRRSSRTTFACPATVNQPLPLATGFRRLHAVAHADTFIDSGIARTPVRQSC